MTATYIPDAAADSSVADTVPAGGVLTETDRAGLTPQAWDYANSSFTLLRKAERCYASWEPLQTCLYAWGAAEDIGKAVAENWKDYGVTHRDERDLWVLTHRLMQHDSEMMVAAAAICESSISSADKDRAIAALVREQTREEMEAELDTGFHAAERLRECFYEGDVDDRCLEQDLGRVANYINRMLYWLRQPHPPVGFRQHNWQEPFAHPTKATGVSTTDARCAAPDHHSPPPDFAEL